MSGSAARSGRHGKRWPAVGAALVVVAVAVIVITTGNGPLNGPVVVVMTHATIRDDWQDAAVAVNGSGHSVDYACGINVTPRTNATFTLPPGAVVCTGKNIPIGPHSRHRVQPSIQPEPPGKYWVWFDYFYGPVGGATIQTTAYAKLTVLP